MESGSVGAWRGLALIYKALGRREDANAAGYEALALLRKGATLSADESWVQEYLQRDIATSQYDDAEAARKRGDHSVAIRAYAEATRLLPDMANAWFGMGDSCFALEQYVESARAYAEVVGLRPTEASGWQRLTLALGKAGRIAEAATASRRLRSLNTAMADEVDRWLASLPR